MSNERLRRLRRDWLAYWRRAYWRRDVREYPDTNHQALAEAYADDVEREAYEQAERDEQAPTTWRSVLCVVSASRGWLVPVGVLVERPDGILEWYCRGVEADEVGGASILAEVDTETRQIAHRGLYAPLRRCVFGVAQRLPDDVVDPLDTAAWLREHWIED